MTRLDEILQQQSGSFSRHKYDTANHRLYPLYFFDSFCLNQYDKSLGRTVQYPVLKSDYTGEEPDPNDRGYYTGYVLFLSADDVRFTLSRKHVREAGALEYSCQIHGFKTPFEYDYNAATLAEKMVIRALLPGEPVWYKMNLFRRGVTGETIKELCGIPGQSGCTFLDGHVTLNGSELEYEEYSKEGGYKTVARLRLPAIVDIVNRIIISNTHTNS